jgi:hypothetical protein
MTTQYRQGDVLLVRTGSRDLDDAELDDAKIVPRNHGRIILAEGEATGHAHAIDSPEAALLEVGDGERYLRVDGPAALTHEEHGAIELEAGLYRVIRQREYGPGMPEYVRD